MTHREPTARRPPRRRSPSACRPPPTERGRLAASGSATGRCGRPRARRSSPTASAGWTSRSGSPPRPSDLRRARRRGARRGHHRRRPAGHGRLEPRARGAPALVRGRRHPPARARLDPPGPDPRGARRARSRSTTLFIVSSKSGGTIETMSQFKYFHSLQGDGAHYVAVTDPGSSLAQLGAEHGFRRVFENDPDIGGRYSVLSYFGLVPAAIAGYDVGAVLATAQAAMEACRAEQDNPGLVARRRARRAGAAGPRQADLRRRRAARVVRPVGRAARRRVDRQGGPRDPADRRRAARARRRVRRRPRVPARRPRATSRSRARSASSPPPGTRCSRSTADGPADLGRVFFLVGVRHRGGGLGAWRSTRSTSPTSRRPRTTPSGCSRKARPSSRTAASTSCSARSRPPRYLAIMAYVPYSDAVEAAAARRRERVVRDHHVATTFGYGPRFLHSTGQFHKGGPAVGAFLQIVDEPAGGPRGPRRALHLRHADPRAGRR